MQVHLIKNLLHGFEVIPHKSIREKVYQITSPKIKFKNDRQESNASGRKHQHELIFSIINSACKESF